MQITAEQVVPVGKQKRSAIWNIECSDLAVLDRQTPRHEPTGCIKCTKCTVITSLTGCRVGNSALQRHGRGQFSPLSRLPVHHNE